MAIIKKSRADPGIFVLRIQTLVEFFVANYHFQTETTMFLQSVNAGHHWQWKYCFASRGEQIIGGYPENNYIFSVSLEFSLVGVVGGEGFGVPGPSPWIRYWR